MSEEAQTDTSLICDARFCWYENKDRPLDEYDLSALYLLIGLQWLVPLDEKIDLAGKELTFLIWRFDKLCRLIRKLDVSLTEELIQRKNQMTNLERRVYALEEKADKKKDKYAYH